MRVIHLLELDNQVTLYCILTENTIQETLKTRAQVFMIMIHVMK